MINSFFFVCYYKTKFFIYIFFLILPFFLKKTINHAIFPKFENKLKEKLNEEMFIKMSVFFPIFSKKKCKIRVQSNFSKKKIIAPKKLH